MKKAVFVLMLLSGHVHAINKCIGPDGTVTYQDAVCPNTAKAAEQVKVQTHTSGQTGNADLEALRAKGELAKLQHRTAIQSGINRGEPVIGMTTSQLHQAMGAPNKVNAANYNGSLQDQLIYYRNGRTLYVYTDNGMVRSIQNTDGAPSSTNTTQGDVKPCPSSLEIRNARTSANSITDNPAIQKEKMDLVRRMERCWK